MLQALVDKRHPYSHKWTTRRVVFEPTHRYLLYSAELSGDHAKREAVQEAIAECRDIENTWKHKMKVTSITREAQEHRRSPEHFLKEDFSVRELLEVRVEGYRRAVGNYDRYANATHATFDESSPMLRRPKQASDVQEPPKAAVIMAGEGARKGAAVTSGDDVSGGATPVSNDDGQLDDGQTKEVWSFRFFSEAVFWQWYTTIVSTLERDHLVPRPDRFALTTDPRNHLPLPKLPLHLLSSFSILEPIVVYLILKGTRVFLDHAAAQEATRRGEAHAIHLTRYQEASGITMPTYLVFTDVSAVFARYDGNVAAVIAYRDLSEVWFHDTSTEDSFLLFRFRDGLTADFLFVASSGGDTNSETNPLYAGTAWRDPTQMGRDGTLAAINVLRALQPMIAEQRQHLLDALKTIPAFKSRLGEFSYLEQGAAQKDIPLLGMNIYANFKEFVLAEHDHIRWENGSLEARKAARFPKKTLAVTKKIELSALHLPSSSTVASAAASPLPDRHASRKHDVHDNTEERSVAATGAAVKGPVTSNAVRTATTSHPAPQPLERMPPELPTKKSSNLRELVMSPMRKPPKQGTATAQLPQVDKPVTQHEKPLATDTSSPERSSARPAIDLDTLFSPVVQKERKPVESTSPPPHTHDPSHHQDADFEIDDTDL